jgi:hypothetical protein
MKRYLFVASLVVLALLFVGCGNDDPATESDAGAEPTEAAEPEGAEVLITAVDYKFDLEATYPAGPTTFSLQNDGDEPHFIDIVELTEDAPALEKLLKMGDNKVGKFFVGQPNHISVVKPGESAEEPVEIDLVAGARYGYVCFVENKKGVPHAFLGMAGEFTVE